MALASKVQTLASKVALTIFGITFKHKKENKINNSYNKKLIIIYVLTHYSTFLDEGWRQHMTTPISFFSIVLDLVTSPLAEFAASPLFNVVYPLSSRSALMP